MLIIIYEYANYVFFYHKNLCVLHAMCDYDLLSSWEFVCHEFSEGLFSCYCAYIPFEGWNLEAIIMAMHYVARIPGRGHNMH